MSSGVEPSAVAGGEFFIGSASEFEFSDPGWPDAKVLGGCGEDQVLGSAGGPEVAVVRDGAVSDQCLEDFAGDGTFEGTEDGSRGPALGEVSIAVSAGLRVVGEVGATRTHRDRGGAAQGREGSRAAGQGWHQR